MILDETRPPTWSKVESDGTKFVTYDSDLTPIQLQTLDKIVENIELNYDAITTNRDLTENEAPHDQAKFTESYMFKDSKDKNGYLI